MYTRQDAYVLHNMLRALVLWRSRSLHVPRARARSRARHPVWVRARLLWRSQAPRAYSLSRSRCVARGERERVGGVLGDLFVLVMDDGSHQRGEGRIAERFTMADFLGVEGFEVVTGNWGQRVVVGDEGLDHDLSGSICTTRTARDLGEELEGSFGGAKVG